MTAPTYVTPTPRQLALFLNIDDEDLDEDRANLLIGDAEGLCASVLSPLPAAAAAIVRRVAGRAYVNVSSAHSVSLGSGAATYGSPNTNVGIGGLYLSRSDKADLRRMAGGGGAFTINLLSADYTPTSLQVWDVSSAIVTDGTS